MRSWAELWHHFTAVMAQAPVALVLSVWVGLALVVVMALEGFLLNIFPACVFHRYLEKMPDRKKRSGAPPKAEPAPAPKPVVIAAPPPPAPVIVAPPPPVVAEPPAIVPAAAPVAAPIVKSRPRKTRNPKKPAPGPKPRRATSARRDTPRRERLSRGTPRLLLPKN